MERIRSLGRDNGGLAVIVAVGLVVRVVAVLIQAGDPVYGDGAEYFLGAKALADGHGFISAMHHAVSYGDIVEPTAQHPPAWLVTLLPVALLGFEDMLAYQLWSCVLGAATVGVVGLAGRQLVGPRVGLLAAAIAALYPNFWMYERVLLSETLALLLVALGVLMAYRFWEQPSHGRAAAVGLVCGPLALTRAEAALLVLLLLVPLTWLLPDTPRRSRAGWLAVATATVLVTLAPWAVYNTLRFDQPVLLTTSLGNTASSTNCSTVYEGPDIGYWSYDCGAHGIAAAAAAGHDDAASSDVAQRRWAFGYARDHAGRVPLVVLAREGRVWGLFQPFRQVRLDSTGGPNVAVATVGLLAYWLLTAAAVGGAVVLRRRGVPLFPLLAFVVTVAVGVAVTAGITRYRALAEPPIVLLAAVALDHLWRVSRSRSEDRDRDDAAAEQAAMATTVS